MTTWRKKNVGSTLCSIEQLRELCMPIVHETIYTSNEHSNYLQYSPDLDDAYSAIVTNGEGAMNTTSLELVRKYEAERIRKKSLLDAKKKTEAAEMQKMYGLERVKRDQLSAAMAREVRQKIDQEVNELMIKKE